MKKILFILILTATALFPASSASQNRDDFALSNDTISDWFRKNSNEKIDIFTNPTPVFRAIRKKLF
ncbi:MAG: hypothetical protein LBC09_05020 [Helicobacteraceae bacterium]|nr:hypothetical protein [Helicobacteraceae bacterium]